MGVADDSFKKSGAVPFKWEIKPGVPKFQSRRTTTTTTDLPSSYSPPDQKLRPPPSGSIFNPPTMDRPRTASFRSAPRTRSERWRFGDRQTTMVGMESVSSSGGCFFSPLLRRIGGKSRRRTTRGVEPSETHNDYSSDLETLSRWSVSSRKSFFSPFRNSPSPSSSSSFLSSPRPLSDAEWAGFGLF